ncbi:hypothetical protein GCM10009662_31270 [Catellatospora coxensis]|uniref:Uncharacterized protein n=1 Tax=Catellatospora coxensis TaxID=310354 RepID=A0A8J3L1U7_9ACTN|nr:hypothetical protein Cco03nite_18000 [Catellatospora coxensis]
MLLPPAAGCGVGSAARHKAHGWMGGALRGGVDGRAQVIPGETWCCGAAAGAGAAGTAGQAQLLVLLQLLLVQPQQLDVLQLQVLVVLHAQLVVLVAPRSSPISAMSWISNVSVSSCPSSSLSIRCFTVFLLPGVSMCA